MQTIRNKYTVALGIAFITQFFTTLISEVVYGNIVVKGNIAKTMVSISQNYTQALFSVLLDIISVVVIIWLGVLLFSSLRKVNYVWAIMGLTMYIAEAFMLFTGKCFQFAFMNLSSIFSTNTNSEMFGTVLYDTREFAYSISMFPFVIGGFLFYYLLYKSRALPSWIPIWGFVSVFLVFIVSLRIYGIPVPFFIAFPYIPFELFIGVYILIKGLSSKSVIWQ